MPTSRNLDGVNSSQLHPKDQSSAVIDSGATPSLDTLNTQQALEVGDSLRLQPSTDGAAFENHGSSGSSSSILHLWPFNATTASMDQPDSACDISLGFHPPRTECLAGDIPAEDIRERPHAESIQPLLPSPTIVSVSSSSPTAATTVPEPKGKH